MLAPSPHLMDSVSGMHLGDCILEMLSQMSEVLPMVETLCPGNTTPNSTTHIPDITYGVWRPEAPAKNLGSRARWIWIRFVYMPTAKLGKFSHLSEPCFSLYNSEVDKN